MLLAWLLLGRCHAWDTAKPSKSVPCLMIFPRAMGMLEEITCTRGHGVVCAFNPGVVSAFNPGVVCAFNAFWAHRHDNGLDDLGDRG